MTVHLATGMYSSRCGVHRALVRSDDLKEVSCKRCIALTQELADLAAGFAKIQRARAEEDRK